MLESLARLMSILLLLTQPLVDCKGGASKGAAASSGISPNRPDHSEMTHPEVDEDTHKKEEDEGNHNWVIYGPILVCIFLITLCVLYDKINNFLMTKRHDNSHVSRRDYSRGTISKETKEEDEEEEEEKLMKVKSEEKSRCKTVNAGEPAGEKFKMDLIQRTPSDTTEIFKMQGTTAGHQDPVMDRQRLLLNQQRNMIDLQKYRLAQQMLVLDKRSPTPDQEGLVWDNELPIWDQKQPTMPDQQKLWEEKIALLDQKIARLEKDKLKHRPRNLEKQRSLDVKRMENFASSSSRGSTTRRPLLSTKSVTIECFSDHGADLEQETLLLDQQAIITDPVSDQQNSLDI